MEQVIKLKIVGSSGTIWAVPAYAVASKFKKHAFAVHKSLDLDSNGWTVTHTRTGFAVAHGVDRKAATEAAHAALKPVKLRQFETLVENAMAKATSPTIGEWLSTEHSE